MLRRYYGLVIGIRGHEELFLEFTKVEHRDDCAMTIMEKQDRLDDEQAYSNEAATRLARLAADTEHENLQTARQHSKDASLSRHLQSQADLGEFHHC